MTYNSPINQNERLYGKSLQTLVTEALNNLNKSREHVILSDISKEILLTRPELINHLTTRSERKNLHLRIRNCIKGLKKTGLIKTELKEVPTLNISYYIIYTKIY